MAQRDVEKLRRELDGVTGRQGRCFPKGLKDRVSRWISEQRAVGATVSELAAQLGLAQGTVLRWSTQSPHTQTRALLPVTVVPDPSIERRLSVVSPSGFRIEELTFAEAAALLKALG
jgi:hypothetical protein